MKYNNMLNKIAVMFACSFLIAMANTHSCAAEELPQAPAVESANPEITDASLDEDVLDLDSVAEDDTSDSLEPVQKSDENTDIPVKETASEEVVEEDIFKEPVEDTAKNIEEDDFLNEDANKEAPIVAPEPDNADTSQANPALLDVQPFPDNADNLDALETDVNKAQIDSTADVDAVIPEIGEAKSPFESFGNAILSKVDNDLFNQMSNIEKQTTLLRLELRREELKSRVEALRNARLKAQQEEDARIRAEKEREKDLEAARQAQIIAEQEKLKQQEIELEKVRQEKVLNDYRNEMLLINQQWVSKNGELQKRIRELEEEQKVMAKDYRDKISQLHDSIATLIPIAENAVRNYKRKMESLNSHINQLKTSMLEREDEIKQLSNPFSEDGTPSKDAIDMSREYAIMDITGKGDDVIAKIVSKDGTTFIVHKGSMLKNGEVVTSITDHYISFENDGVQSYLYTGGTVMEYEPLVTFNGSDRTPPQTDKQIIKGNSSNVLGVANDSKKPASTVNTKKDDVPVLIKKPKKPSNNLSFGSGTFVK